MSMSQTTMLCWIDFKWLLSHSSVKCLTMATTDVSNKWDEFVLLKSLSS